MLRSDLGDIDPWVPFLAELRQAQSGDPVEVWLLDPAGDRQATDPNPTALGIAMVDGGPGLSRPAESHAIPVRRVTRTDAESPGAARRGRVAFVRFHTDGGGQATHA